MKLKWNFRPTREEVSDALTGHGTVAAISDTENIPDEIELGYADGTIVRIVANSDGEDTYFGYAIGLPEQEAA